MADTTRQESAPLPPCNHEVLAFLDFWRQLTLEERARIIKATNPEWCDRQVARVAGVSTRTLYRCEGYRRFKALCEARLPANSKWRGRQHRRINPPPDEQGFSNPDDRVV